MDSNKLYNALSKTPVGLRTLKTAITAGILALIYMCFDHSPAFACIGVVFGTGQNLSHSIREGGNRAIGTLVGGLIGMGLFSIYLKIYPDGHYTPLLALFLTVGLVLFISICKNIWAGGIPPGSVVLCILFFNTPVETYASYAIWRIIDTFIGVVAGVLVSSYILPYKPEKTAKETAELTDKKDTK